MVQGYNEVARSQVAKRDKNVTAPSVDNVLAFSRSRHQAASTSQRLGVQKKKLDRSARYSADCLSGRPSEHLPPRLSMCPALPPSSPICIRLLPALSGYLRNTQGPCQWMIYILLPAKKEVLLFVAFGTRRK